MPGSAPIVAALRRHPELDPRAVLAVAAQEGLGGGIGDQGTSFGPFQLHRGGALPASVPLSSAQDWAWGPQGLEYALSRISGVAGGRRGADAVSSIVRRFERPADPGGEVSRALASYGSGAGAAAGAPSSLAAAAAPGGDRRAFALQLLRSISPTGQLDNNSLVGALQARQAPLNAAWGTPGGPTVGGKAGQGQAGLPPLPKPSTSGGGIAELLKEGVGGPTHSTGPHIHAAFTDPQLELAAIDYAKRLGLSVRENPYVGDPVDPVHAPNSFHTRTFPGLFDGRKLGEAVDVSGPRQDAFYQWLAGRRR